MSFKSIIKANVTIGDEVTIVKHGLTYEGEILNIDYTNPSDAAISLITEENDMFIVAIDQDMVLWITAEQSKKNKKNKKQQKSEEKKKNKTDGKEAQPKNNPKTGFKDVHAPKTEKK